MEILYFTISAIALYALADFVLQRLEVAAGRRFEQRSLIFFAILFVFAVTSFYVIRNIVQ